ncbi:MAG: hypothetical protein HGA86_02570 [Anaerolineaceae bacterium]|jgi:hypothetical protein|nr:hypothetical protein [Anaerolineaceae bacterium]
MKPKRKFPFISLQTLVTATIILVSLMVVFWGEPIFAPVSARNSNASATVTPVPAAMGTEEPRIPIEYTQNEMQTNGIILGGTLLVLLVVGGTVSVITRRDGKQ